MKTLLQTINVILQSFIAGISFGAGILAIFGLAGIIVANKLLPIINDFIGNL